MLPPHAGGAAALMVWYGILGILAVIGYSGLLLGVAVIVMYVLTLRSLWKLSKELDEAGYGVRPAPVRVSDRAVAGALAAVLALGCACGYLLGGRYPMEWAPVDAGEHSGVEESKARLLALGVPDYVLNDLTAEDLAACDGAILVVVDVDDYPVNSGRRVSHSYWIGGERHTNIHTVYDVKELRITGVGVELPGERWMLIQHFLWTTPPGFCGTESIQLWPAYRAGMEGWRSGGALTGRVLYDEGGPTLPPTASWESRPLLTTAYFGGSRSETTCSRPSLCPGTERTAGAMWPIPSSGCGTATLWTAGSTTPTSRAGCSIP